MNNFLKNLQFYQTGQLVRVQEPFSFKEYTSDYRFVEDMRVYELSATIGSRASIRPGTLSEEQELIKHDMAQALNEHMHGGYKLPLLDLRTHLYRRGDVEGANMVGKIIDGMFKV